MLNKWKLMQKYTNKLLKNVLTLKHKQIKLV